MEVPEPSFTFSSKYFLLKVITVAVLLLGSYSVYLKGNYLAISTGQNQNQENRIKAERYLFGQPTCSVVIVGSSLSDGLKDEYFDGRVCNLAFGGGSSLWGLELLNKSSLKPKVVLVEMNVLVAIDNDFMNTLFGRPDRDLKHASPLFLQSSQPVTQGLNLLRKVFPPPKKTFEASQTEQWVEYFLKNYSGISEEQKKNYEDKISQVFNYLQQMQANGTRVLLFNMPIDSRLENSMVRVWEKEQWQRRSRERGVEILDLERPSGLATKDGIHLVDDSLLVLVPYIKAASFF